MIKFVWPLFEGDLLSDKLHWLLKADYSESLSFLVPNPSTSATWAGPGRKSHVDAYTSTQEPFLQALVDEESADNVIQIFETATELGEKHAGLNLRKQVVQVRKDYAQGIDVARRRVFP